MSSASVGTSIDCVNDSVCDLFHRGVVAGDNIPFFEFNSESSVKVPWLGSFSWWSKKILSVFQSILGLFCLSHPIPNMALSLLSRSNNHVLILWLIGEARMSVS